MSLLVATYISVAPAMFEVDGRSSPNDYPSCMFDAIAVDISANDIATLKQQCRREFPNSTGTAWLVWADVGQCYDRQEVKAGNRIAALALFNACSEYFL